MGRLFVLQVVHGDRYAQTVTDSRIIIERTPAKRGRILDRNGVPIVDNRAVYHLAVVLSSLEFDRRARRAVPFRVFDDQAVDALVGDLAAQTFGNPRHCARSSSMSLSASPGLVADAAQSVAVLR